ncbi:MAG: DUF1570 domain-containing protein, partial [Pyrinomonadaceae bacterium]
MKRSFAFVAFVLLTLSVCQDSVAAPKDEWIRVRSKNFHLIGNAPEKDIRGVATKLEQFREAFQRIFPGMKVSSPIPTTVIVFKSGSSYRPFKPKRPDGKPDDGIAGYFQPADDVNYITLSTEGENEDTFGTIFHEYVHFMLDSSVGKANIPTWFNEGLAEYYQTYRIEEDQKVTLGTVQSGHLYLLNQTKLIPFKQFFEVDSYTLHANGDHSRSIFYAQAWAIIHYLIQGNGGKNAPNLERFVSLLLRDIKPETAFQQAFGTDYATMEKELRTYVGANKYTASQFTFREKLIFDTQMTVEPVSETLANAYLGDLLLHTQQYNDAAAQLTKVLSIEPDNVMANTSMGLVKMRQRNYPEAKRYLERAIALDGKDYFAQYSYAMTLSREGVDEFGFVQKYPADSVVKMRTALLRAIELQPQFPESYRMLGFLGVVNGENLDESLKYVNRGLALKPGDPDMMLLSAKILLRQEKFDSARSIAEKVARSTDEKDTKSEAEGVINQIQQITAAKAAFDKQLADAKSQYDQNAVKLNLAYSKPPKIIKRKDITDEQLKQIERDRFNLGINSVLPPLQTGEERAVGKIDLIKCENGLVRFMMSAKSGPLTLSSVDFQAVHLAIYKEGTENFEVGCSTNLSKEVVVATYRPSSKPIPGTDGQVLAFAFMPPDFRLMTQQEMADSQLIIIEGGPPTDLEKNANAAATEQ